MGKYEEPHFEVLDQEGAFQIRKYDAFLTAMTKDNTLRGSGFNKLFSFISGENERREKLAMTIPVINDSNDVTMEFVLPLKYKNIEDAPIPTHPNVSLKAYPESVVAAITFSGKSSENTIIEKQELLKTWVVSKGYIIDSPYRLARYNAPLTPGFLRRNEIHYTIKEKA